ncbi:hypothetical protein QJS10_CPB18g01040 [Acorus calamus]|uniref:Uncharacterized protein n=1 Tax=Acorus calamus TaxID=4465 RepID=A0AAV9CNW9_ACOCL|nr:hypothetical protein QJS10_CPB18g01040 [Acorus calamus]
MESPAPRKNQNRPLKWLDLASTEPYYLLHLLSFFSYFAARPSSDRLLQLEIQAILLFLALTIVKLVKEETWEGFIGDTLFYAKGFLFVMALVIDYRLALCYVVGFLGVINNYLIIMDTVSVYGSELRVIHVLTQQPASDGLGQLPTYILFDNAVEVARYPEISFDARSSSPTITKSILCRYFELDRRLIEYISGK